MTSIPEPACPVCDSPLPGHPGACPKCGVPIPLHAEAAALLRERDPFVRPPTAGPAPRRPSASKASAAPATAPLDPIADDIDRSRALMERLGASPDELAGEVRRAALLESKGQAEEAARTLSATQSRARETVRGEIERRARDLDAHRSAFAKGGLGNVAESGLAEVHRLLTQQRYPEAVPKLLEIEARIRRLSEELEAVRAPLGSVSELLEIAESAGLQFPEEARQAEQLRVALAEPGALPSDFARIAEQAEALRGALLERLPSEIRAELAQHEGALRGFPEDHPPARAARERHAQAVAHLESGRLPDAASALAGLRRSIRELGDRPLPRVEVEPAPSPSPPGATVSVPELVQTARQLAARVRGLDPGSELAAEAAAQIRQATELLRARRLDEAAQVLQQLMAALDHAELPAERSVPQ